MKILDGNIVSNQIKNDLINEINNLKNKPKMVDIQIGNDSASNIYRKRKEKIAKEVGIKYDFIQFDEDVEETDIINKINEFNNNPDINGIFIQSPIPNKFDRVKIINSVNPKKDIDGLTYLNAGILLNNKESLIPCTPNSVLHILKFYNINLTGKNIVIIGRSNLVGKPLMHLLLNEDATVTLCHSKTNDIHKITKKADIVIVAIGKKDFLNKEMIKKNCIVIDVGINSHDGKIYGDVNFESVKNKVKAITPVPGGVGPMTVTMLLYNVLKSYKMQNK